MNDYHDLYESTFDCMVDLLRYFFMVTTRTCLTSFFNCTYKTDRTIHLSFINVIKVNLT